MPSKLPRCRSKNSAVQDETNCFRLRAVSAASEKPSAVQPPMEIRVRRCGCRCLSSASAAKCSAASSLTTQRPFLDPREGVEQVRQLVGRNTGDRVSPARPARVVRADDFLRRFGGIGGRGNDARQQHRKDYRNMSKHVDSVKRSHCQGWNVPGPGPSSSDGVRSNRRTCPRAGSQSAACFVSASNNQRTASGNSARHAASLCSASGTTRIMTLPASA